MATIQSAIELQDNFSSVLYGVINAVNITILEMEKMNQAMDVDMDIDTSSLIGAREELASASTKLGDMVTKVENVEEPVQRVANGFSGWQRGILVANQAIGLIRNTIGRTGITDMSGAFDRLDTMNRFQRTVTTMTQDSNLANAALSEIRENVLGTAYGLDVAAKSVQGFTTRGMALGTAADQVRIWADAVSFYGEGTNEQLGSVIDAVGKMYSKGTVEADQLDRLFDAGIGAAEIYAAAVGESVSSVKDDLSDGVISAAQFIQTVSEAMDRGISHGAAKEAGGTWAVTFANMHAAFTRGWMNVIQSADQALAARGLPSSMQMVEMFGEKAESVLGGIGNAMNFVVGVAVKAGDLIGVAGGFITDNWSIIEPIIGGVSTALLLYVGYLGAAKVAELVLSAVRITLCLASYAHAEATGTIASATAVATAQQYGLNTALLSCPVTWMIVGFLGIVTVLGIVIAAYNRLNNTHVSTIGAICGTTNIAVQFVKNAWLGFMNFWIGISMAIEAIIQNIGIFFGNLGLSIKSTWYGILESVTDVIIGLCDLLNKLPFVDIDTTGLESAASHYAAEQYEANASKQEYRSVGDAFTDGMLTYDVDDVFSSDFVLDAYHQGYDFGAGLKDKFDLFNMTGGEGVYKMESIEAHFDKSGLTSNIDNMDKNTSKIAKSLDITSENIKYIRDFATQRAINRYTSTTIKVDMTNHNSINGEQDIDGIMNKLNSRIEEELYASAEGVH